MTKEELIQRLEAILNNPTESEKREPFASAIDAMLEYVAIPRVERLLDSIEEIQVEIESEVSDES